MGHFLVRVTEHLPDYTVARNGRRVNATLYINLKLTAPLKMPARTFGIQNTVAILYIANFGEESNNSAANADQAAFWLYKPRRNVWGVEV
jgi:hypothetical protein